MGKMRSWSVRGLLAASFFVSTAALTPIIPSAQATETVQTQTGMFRVALYINSGKFNTTVPSVGLSSSGGLKVGIRSANSVYNWFNIPAYKNFRASLDQFQIKVLETDDLSQAQAAMAAIGIKANSVIYMNSVLGKPLYQVLVGDYLTKENAQLTLNELLKTPASAVYAKKASISGPLHLSAGTFATESEARTKAESMRLSGVPVDVVFQGDSVGKATFSLWVGGEADTSALSKLQTELEAKVQGLKLSMIDASAAYFIEKEEISTAGSNGKVRYLMNPVGQKAWISPVSSKITVQEKGLSYNGAFELSRLNNKLAVVNELPFEQYLYSVVHAELGSGHPKEALKAQAVAARTYSAKAGIRYEIANLTDTTLDQAYYGKEAADVTAAVNETKGEVLKIGNSMIDTFFSSNAGGKTADGSEVWGNQFSYLQSVDSPDSYAQQGKLPWYRIFRDNGISGYVRSDLLNSTGTKTAAGLPLYTAIDNANVRTIPSANDSISPTLGKLDIGEQVTVISKSDESTSYSWIRLLTASQLLPKINTYYPLNILQTLEVAKRGVSGRVMGLSINGSDFTLRTPDSFRGMMGGVPSTLFEIEETGRYTVLGATGARTEYTGGSVLSAATQTNEAAVLGKEFLVQNGQGKTRLATQSPQFLFTGKGYGHGLGMSQYGAIGMAMAGNDYVSILSHYYSGATIVKQ